MLWVRFWLGSFRLVCGYPMLKLYRFASLCFLLRVEFARTRTGAADLFEHDTSTHHHKAPERNATGGQLSIAKLCCYSVRAVNGSLDLVAVLDALGCRTTDRAQTMS